MFSHLFLLLQEILPFLTPLDLYIFYSLVTTKRRHKGRQKRRFFGFFTVECLSVFSLIRCAYTIAPEQKARATYDNILRLADDPDVIAPIRCLREREVVHYQRFGEALRLAEDRLDGRNFYACNPGFDKNCGKTCDGTDGNDCGCGGTRRR